MNRCLLVALLALGASRTPAADSSLKTQVQTLWRATGLPLTIPMEGALELQLPPVPPRAGQTAVLCVQARLDCAANSGWNKFLSLELNGQPVYQTVSGTRNGPHRVLNRDTEWAPPGMESDYVLFRGHNLCVVFAPDFKQFDQRLAPEGEESFWYVLNLSDLLRPAGENRLKLGNLARAVWFGGQQHGLVLGDVSVGYLPTPTRGQGAARFRPRPAGQTLHGPRFELVQTPTGGLAVALGREHYLLETQVTWPHGGRNRLACPDAPATGPQDWRIIKATLDDRGGTLVAEGASYRLTRELRPDGARVRVADTLTNLTDRELGVELAYQLTAGEPLPALYLGGNDDPSLASVEVCGANPTVFASQTQGGLGWLAEDDVLRAQLRLGTQRGVTSLKCLGLGFAPRGSHTLRWTLYPTPAGDYWDFINQVRRDWDVNFRIDGPFSFIGNCQGLSATTAEKLRQRFAGRRVGLAAMHPWTAYQYPYDRELHKGWWRKAQPMVHEALAGAKCLLLMEPPLESRVHQSN